MKKAFTIIELLVVISIIAILIAMLVPMLYTGREVARLSLCASNLSQNGKSIEILMTDSLQTSNVYDDMAFPELGKFNYVFHKEILVCPNDPEPFEMLAPWFDSNESLKISYGINIEFQVFRITKDDIRDPSSKAVLFDGAPSELFEDDGNGNGRNEDGKKADIIHIPPGNHSNPIPISVGWNAVPAHIKHGCPFGRPDAQGRLAAQVKRFFNPRHPTGNYLGNILFADGHVNHFQRMNDSMLMNVGMESLETR